MTKDSDRTISWVGDKVENEGLGYAITDYIGPELRCESIELNSLWKDAYHLLRKIEGILAKAE